LAVLETDGKVEVFLQGTEEEVENQAQRIGGRYQPGLHWPDDPVGDWRWSLRVPPASTSEALTRLPDDWSSLALHGVGEVRAASSSLEGASDLREWAESLGGCLVMTSGDPGVFDPWGRPPPGLDLQRRLIAEFDPRRILNPGRLPGGL
jgi:hypothetical protein